MKHIGADQAVVTADEYDEYDREPTAAELDAIEREMPRITRDVEQLDVLIKLLNRPVPRPGGRRERRARRRMLTVRRDLANRGQMGAVA